jgi:hypothetical protein
MGWALHKHGVPGPVLQAERTARDQGGEVWIYGVAGVVPDC